MARRGRKRGGFGRGGGGSFIDAALEGVGVAALTKRFIGAPVGQYTGIAAGAGYAMLRKKNLLGTVAGAALHDFVGNVGGASSSGSTQVY